MKLSEEDINSILVGELGKLGALEGATGGALGAKFTAKRLATESYQATLRLALPEGALVKLVKRQFGYQRPETIAGGRQLFRKITGSGFFNMNPTLVLAVVDGQAVHLIAYAKEGFIKQHSAQKAVQALAGSLRMPSTTSDDATEDEQRGSVRIALLVVALMLVILVGLGGAGLWYEHHHGHKPTANTNSARADSSSPHVVKYSLANTGLHFSYPSNWTLTDESLPPSNLYGVLLTGPNQLVMIITVKPSTGYGGDNANILLSEAVRTLGGSYYLNYLGLPSDNGLVDKAILSTAPTASDQFVDQLPRLAGHSGSDLSVQISFVHNGQLVAQPLAAFQGDAAFRQAKLVVESMSAD